MDARIKRLDEQLRAYAAMQRPTVFLLDGGGSFTTDLDPLAYLMQHGVETPQGRIMGMERRGAGYTDPLSQSLYGLVDEGIRQGGLQSILDVESDMV